MNDKVKKNEKGLFYRALLKTKQKIASVVATLGGKDKLTFEDLEEILISIDYPVAMAEEFVERAKKNFVTASDALNSAKSFFIEKFEKMQVIETIEEFTVILVVGVNGSGKTTFCAKLAKYYQNQGKDVLLCAADTFRAAGSEQLEVWAKRLKMPVVSQERGAHPGAVVHDAVEKAKAMGKEIVIADTAGRLHSKTNLMEELKKVKKSALKAASGSKVLSILVIDAFFGQNTFKQVEQFQEALGIDYLAVTKVDGTTKAGSLLAASLKFNVPIAFVGFGESANDLRPFEAERFLEELFSTEGQL